MMGRLRLEDIVQATGGKVLCGNAEEFSGLSIDSRTIRAGELFVALKGDHFDGHDYINSALAGGRGALVHLSSVEPPENTTVILVQNTLEALQNLARHLRFKSAVPVIGVTGTNGKTTTKELIASIFGQRQKVLKTSGNLNNHIGLPLCLGRMDGDEDIMVLEMGSNARGDIRQLCEIALPDFAVVTNVGPAHLEGFGSLEAVRDTDLEILAYAKTASVNADDAFLLEGITNYRGRLITYGIKNNADVSAKDIMLGTRGSGFKLCLPGKRKIAVSLQLSGTFNIYNALAAASVADALGIGLDDIKNGLESFGGVPMRLEIKEMRGALVISDVYNANPASMEEALKELVRLKRKRTIAVLGDMLELGGYAGEAHKKLVRLVSDLNIDLLVAVGPEMSRAAAEFKGSFYTSADSESARSLLSGICGSGDAILVKGSRGMLMEKVLQETDASGAGEGTHAL
ncbi:MAG: UDP-N-acetylmuramoyl-tripeptide--D-alanyl-D-alanine ligase [Nitrospirota bacterium]|nr:UDP-N-acetylmuramoyl-tripeptide--D-alanyl-D-alanine ligase [Nitrospirota bacterium]